MPSDRLVTWFPQVPGGHGSLHRDVTAGGLVWRPLGRAREGGATCARRQWRRRRRPRRLGVMATGPDRRRSRYRTWNIAKMFWLVVSEVLFIERVHRGTYSPIRTATNRLAITLTATPPKHSSCPLSHTMESLVRNVSPPGEFTPTRSEPVTSQSQNRSNLFIQLIPLSPYCSPQCRKAF